jgi:hypothetical protein
MKTEYTREILLEILEGYKKMIERSGAEYPTVVLDDIAKSIDHVKKEAKQ